MAKKFSDFEFADPIDVDLETMPEQRGGWDPPPQPGKNFLVMLPEISLDDDAWDEEKNDDGEFPVYTCDPGIGKGAMVVQSPHGDSEIGKSFRLRISGAPRSFNNGAPEGDDEEEGEAPKKFSVMGYIIKAVFASMGWKLPVLKTGNQWAQALTKCSGKQIMVDVDWEARCNPDRPKFAQNEDGEIAEVDGETGCGQRFGLTRRKIRKGKSKGDVVEQIPKVTVDSNGVRQDQEGYDEALATPKRLFALRWECLCGATISPFLQVRNIRPASLPEEGEVQEPEPVIAQEQPKQQAAPAKKSAAAPATAPKKK